MMKLIYGLTAAVLFLYLMGIAGKMDYQEEVRQEQEYTEMVCKGLWPDYNNTVDVKKDC